MPFDSKKPADVEGMEDHQIKSKDAEIADSVANAQARVETKMGVTEAHYTK